MFSKAVLFTAAFMAATVSGHMHMTSPAALGAKENTFTPSGTADFNYDSPLSASGGDFPCKGKLSLLGTAAGASVDTWAPGSQQNVAITGGARHNGGSCQVSLSEDQGATWKVMKTFIGDCPSAAGALTFTVPQEAKEGEAVFAWTWFNQVGNREMYMNCAAVTIKGGSGSGLSALPDMFVANIGNGCSSNAESTGDLDIPNPGADVENKSSKTGPPVGTCAGGVGTPPVNDTPTPSKPAIVEPVPTKTYDNSAPTSVVDTPTNSTEPIATVPTTAPTKTSNDGLFPPTETAGPGGAGNTGTFDDGKYRPGANGWKQKHRRRAHRFRA